LNFLELEFILTLLFELGPQVPLLVDIQRQLQEVDDEVVVLDDFQVAAQALQVDLVSSSSSFFLSI